MTPPASIPEVLSRAAADRPDKPALVYGQRTLSYGEFQAAVRGLAARLRSEGVGRGRRAAILYANGHAFIVSYFAVLAASGSAVPLNPAANPDEIADMLRRCRAEVVLSDRESGFPGARTVPAAPGTEPVPEPEASGDDEAMVLFTSGTTSRPKGVVHSHKALLVNASEVAGTLGMSSSDVTLLFLPLYFSYGLSQMLTTFIAGGTLALLDRFLHPAFVARILRERAVTGFGGVPSHHRLIVERYEGRPLDLPRLRYVMNAGGAITEKDLRALRVIFPRAAIINGYGCTEMGPRATWLPFEHFDRKAGSIGVPLPSVKVKVLREDGREAAPGEIGEIVLRGPTLMKGYLDEPQLKREVLGPEGFHTGDLGVRDEEGFLWHKGRQDDLFKSGGEKVNARLVEEVVLGIDGVLEAAVVGVPDEVLGMAPKAVIVTRDGKPLKAEEVIAYVHERLPLSHVPRIVEFTGELKKTANGKVQKFAYA